MNARRWLSGKAHLKTLNAEPMTLPGATSEMEMSQRQSSYVVADNEADGAAEEQSGPASISFTASEANVMEDAGTLQVRVQRKGDLKGYVTYAYLGFSVL